MIRPVLESPKGLAFAQAIIPWYSKIDAFHMMTCTIDEAVRRIIAVGGNLDHIGGVDNFCWPDIGYDRVKNPDGRFKAAQLVRACRALKQACLAYGIPLLSGKDSMYVDGHLTGNYGETIKVSALPTMQFSTTGVIDDIESVVTMDPKITGDLVYVLGDTFDELGGSEYYELCRTTGLNVPKVDFERFKVVYRALTRAMEKGIIASAHAVARGGIGVHLSLSAMAGGLGMEIDLRAVPQRGEILRNDTLLFAESQGRFIVTVAPENRETFDKLFKGMAAACVGVVTDQHKNLKIKAMDGTLLVDTSIDTLETAWQRPLGDM